MKFITIGVFILFLISLIKCCINNDTKYDVNNYKHINVGQILKTEDYINPVNGEVLGTKVTTEKSEVITAWKSLLPIHVNAFIIYDYKYGNQKLVIPDYDAWLLRSITYINEN